MVPSCVPLTEETPNALLEEIQRLHNGIDGAKRDLKRGKSYDDAVALGNLRKEVSEVRSCLPKLHLIVAARFLATQTETPA